MKANIGKLDGKVAVVTGANSGIGQACAKRFAQEGDRLEYGHLGRAGVQRLRREQGSGPQLRPQLNP